MRRIILTATLIAMLHLFVGCAVDSGRSQLVVTSQADAAAVAKLANAGESDIVEHLSINRQAYRQALEALISHYTAAGNDMKLAWAKSELAALDSIQQYNYILQASLAGPDLRADTPIAEANELYNQAFQLEKRAKALIIINDDNLLRRALVKYNQLIKRHPGSDKIDDAAYRAGTIYEYFCDYSIAALYYQRAYQWNNDITYPAVFRAAFILDNRLFRRTEALQLYRIAVKRQAMLESQREFAEKRIQELTRSDESGEEIR
ncbi:MAG TPA: hypothetical protein VMW23_06095 [Sedimentisphaerales bacterium]|nr:hypothetical protein [Sedimentisphaerales bacterium]